MKRTLFAVSVFGALLFPGSIIDPASAQQPAPPPPQNLQFFPKNTGRPELVGHMRQFAFALGVRCEHCHVDERAKPGGRQDFAADEKPAKLKARAMLRMTKQINDDLLSKIPDRSAPAVEVTCATCHHGLSRPETLTARLSKAVKEGGARGAVAELKTLRERAEFGLFDVSEWSVNEAASTLAGSDNQAEALALLEANAGYHPESDAIPSIMAEIHGAMGNTDKAVEIVKGLLAKDPENRRLKEQLERLSQKAGEVKP